MILDVVYNHTAEDSDDGPTLSLRGIDNRIYYLLNPANRPNMSDDSGVGNTLNSNHTVVRRMVMDSLRYWVQEMHVDGFRFDLASVLYRGQENEVLKVPPLLWDIDSDPVLAGTKIIAEAWDAAGLYQVGSFVGDRWAVWNGHYRDTVRRFVKSDSGVIRDLAGAHWRQLKRFLAATTRIRCAASISLPPMTASPSMISSPTTISTTKPMARQSGRQRPER